MTLEKNKVDKIENSHFKKLIKISGLIHTKFASENKSIFNEWVYIFIYELKIYLIYFLDNLIRNNNKI